MMTPLEIREILVCKLVKEIEIRGRYIDKIAKALEGEEFERIVVEFPNYEEADDVYNISKESKMDEDDFTLELFSLTNERKIMLFTYGDKVQIAFYKKKVQSIHFGGISIKGNISAMNVNIGGVQTFDGDVVFNSGNSNYVKTSTPEVEWVFDRVIEYEV